MPRKLKSVDSCFDTPSMRRVSARAKPLTAPVHRSSKLQAISAVQGILHDVTHISCRPLRGPNHMLDQQRRLKRFLQFVNSTGHPVGGTRALRLYATTFSSPQFFSVSTVLERRSTAYFLSGSACTRAYCGLTLTSCLHLNYGTRHSPPTATFSCPCAQQNPVRMSRSPDCFSTCQCP